MKIYSTAFLEGGLGNQMFQISHAICQGWKNSVESVFLPVSYTPMQANQPTKYLQNVYRNVKFLDKIDNYRVIKSAWKYTELLLFWDKSIQFHGYYQSSKNFLGFDEKIIDLFSPTEDFIKIINEKYPQLKKPNTVSLHVRRGDYLTIGNVLPTIDISYINKSIETIGNYDFLFVFSDDKKWVGDNLKFDNMIIVSNMEDYEELWMMSLCKNNIMSNSSFSWWGSFLNRNKNKVVVAPNMWFGPLGEKNYQDIYEKNWTLINVKFKNNKLVYEN
jgi:hypothetical protein